MTKNIGDFVKSAPSHLLEVLAHKVRCEHYRPFILHRDMTDYCRDEITLLINRRGKSEVYHLCERKYRTYQARNTPKEYPIDVRDD